MDQAHARAIRQAALAGLDEQEAIGRATQLQELILAGQISRADIQLNDEWKDVLYALVYRVLRDRRGTEEETARRALAVHKFIDRIDWEDDLLDEKRELLGDCAAARRHSGRADRAGASRLPEPARTESEDPSSPAHFSENGISSDEEARRVFECKLPLIHAALTELHELTEAEAKGLEGELLSWFLRFCRRDGKQIRDPLALLLAATLQLAREHLRALEAPEEARVSRLVESALYEIAREGST